MAAASDAADTTRAAGRSVCRRRQSLERRRGAPTQLWKHRRRGPQQAANPTGDRQTAVERPATTEPLPRICGAKHRLAPLPRPTDAVATCSAAVRVMRDALTHTRCRGGAGRVGTPPDPVDRIVGLGSTVQRRALQHAVHDHAGTRPPRMARKHATAGRLCRCGPAAAGVMGRSRSRGP